MSENPTTSRNSQYLNEMGISEWYLKQPELLQGVCANKAELPKACRLLLVSPLLPSGSVASMFEKVLKSMRLELSQSRHILPHQLDSFHLKGIEWIWFAGCDVNEAVKTRVLSSPVLSEVADNTQLKRQLWQQICSYEE
ncbi:DNA polymerase III subunit psi [Vibrio marisflavi]|uniref:DNA polymerase III subunit psi n=1 Tax=Vibrio marisflavi CECT 7928 TaxID=634439 RepID=A0ABN8E430_9VIBR|nr:DNA polymerase III subunit psi [Vibrio marisflavi]CAH0538786.1 DNA polymerase III subunit psi [Vibrio marisflavi CECT 7928]